MAPALRFIVGCFNTLFLNEVIWYEQAQCLKGIPLWMAKRFAGFGRTAEFIS